VRWWFFGGRLAQLALSLEPIIKLVSGFGTTSLIQFIGSPGDVFLARFRVGRSFLAAGSILATDRV
jgi:hypothetical protein